MPRHFCAPPTSSSPQSTWTSQLALSQALGVVMLSVPPHLQTHQGPGFSQTRGFQNAAGHYKVNVMGSDKHFLNKTDKKISDCTVCSKDEYCLHVCVLGQI